MPDDKGVLYQDRRFTVTLADIRTPTLYYPIGDTVGRVRRDIQFAATGIALATGFGLGVYWDLWFAHERLAMGAVIAVAVLIGSMFTMFQIDARGFPSRMFVARTPTVRKIFHAITEARAKAPRASYGGMEAGAEE